MQRRAVSQILSDFVQPSFKTVCRNSLQNTASFSAECVSISRLPVHEFAQIVSILALTLIFIFKLLSPLCCTCVEELLPPKLLLLTKVFSFRNVVHYTVLVTSRNIKGYIYTLSQILYKLCNNLCQHTVFYHRFPANLEELQHGGILYTFSIDLNCPVVYIKEDCMCNRWHYIMQCCDSSTTGHSSRSNTQCSTLTLGIWCSTWSTAGSLPLCSTSSRSILLASSCHSHIALLPPGGLCVYKNAIDTQQVGWLCNHRTLALWGGPIYVYGI